MKEFLEDMILLQVKNMKGKYMKIALEKIENETMIPPQLRPILRKIILDAFNDMYRSVHINIKGIPPV